MAKRMFRTRRVPRFSLEAQLPIGIALFVAVVIVGLAHEHRFIDAPPPLKVAITASLLFGLILSWRGWCAYDVLITEDTARRRTVMATAAYYPTPFSSTIH